MKCPNGCCDILLQYTNNLTQKNIYYNRHKKKQVYSYMTPLQIKYY